MNVFVSCVVVTYSNRHRLCECVIDAALRAGVDEVVVVDNGSEKESVELFGEWLRNKKNIHLISLLENTGSAGGYKAGLEYVISKGESDFVWLLDDDNVPEDNALEVLKSTWSDFFGLKASSDVVLYSYRGGTWPEDCKAVSWGYIKGFVINGFLGFGFVSWLLGFAFSALRGERVNYPIVRANIGPYGGMFISTDNVIKIGFPDERFFVYADDYEYSSRLGKVSVDQFLVLFSRLVDIDVTPSGREGYFSKLMPDMKLYYATRNHVYLGQRYVENRLVYAVNKFFVMIVVGAGFIKCLFEDRWHALSRFRLIVRAISDGEAGRLGKTF